MSNRMPQRNNRPTSRQIYMRRRIVFGTGGLLVIALLWWIISGIVGFVGGIFSPAAAPTASAPVIVAGAPCAPGTVQVIAGIGDSTQTSQASFAKGENPFVWFSLTNNGTVACTFDAGSSVSFYSITSGSETIWDSHDCDRSADASAVITLQPGETQKSGASTWLRVYSSSTGCSTGQTPVAGNGASYHLQATVNGVISNDVQFVLN